MLSARLAVLALGLTCSTAAVAQLSDSAQHKVAAETETEASAPQQPQLVVAVPEAPATAPGAVVVPKGTMVRLMVLSEVNTKHKKEGDRFLLRVDEPVVVNGVTVVPTGAKAWGEVTAVKKNGAAGATGEIGARLLHIDLGDAKIPLEGEDRSKGRGSGDRVAMAVISFGVLGLLTKGNDGKLKGGHIFNGYVADQILFDPNSSKWITGEAEAAQNPQ